MGTQTTGARTEAAQRVSMCRKLRRGKIMRRLAMVIALIALVVGVSACRARFGDSGQQPTDVATNALAPTSIGTGLPTGD
jgi:hypothetical protein